MQDKPESTTILDLIYKAIATINPLHYAIDIMEQAESERSTLADIKDKVTDRTLALVQNGKFGPKSHSALVDVFDQLERGHDQAWMKAIAEIKPKALEIRAAYTLAFNVLKAINFDFTPGAPILHVKLPEFLEFLNKFADLAGKTAIDTTDEALIEDFKAQVWLFDEAYCASGITNALYYAIHVLTGPHPVVPPNSSWEGDDTKEV